jgi:hypothetical protein
MGLTTIMKDKDLNKIFDEEIVVYEDIQGSKLYIKWDGDNFIIKPKSLHGEPITIVDLATQKYYNKAINFFYNLDDRIKSLMPKKWYFIFEYFPDEEPANIKYDKVPKNNLILTGIYKKGKFDYTIEELMEFANLFGTDYLPVIFKGRLNEKQKTAIKYFLNTSKEDLEYVFGEKSFSFFFYKLLNPLYDNSFLMDSDFQENLQKIIIMIEEEKRGFEILNPLYLRMSANNTTEFAEIYSLILLNFLDFCQVINLDKIPFKGKRRDVIYINFISSLFNIYMKETQEDIKEFDISIPKFFDKDKFKINKELITNKLTTQYIEEDDKIEYVFKVILGSFRNKRKKPIGIFNEKTLELFNTLVEDISELIDNYLNKISDKQLRKSGLIDFGKYMDFKIEYDGDGDVYPDVYSEFEAPQADNKKKKGFKDSGDK